MKAVLELEIITANRTVVRTTASEVYVPAVAGRAGVLHDHLPYTALLEMGEIAYQDADGKRHSLFLRRGIIDTEDNRVVIIADQITKAEELDADALRAEMKALKETIRGAAKGLTSPEDLDLALTRERELVVLLSMAGGMKNRGQ